MYSGAVLNENVFPPVQCKLVAVGVFRLLSCINIAVYLLLIPVVINAALIPARQRQQSQLLRPYRLLPAFNHAQGPHTSSGRYDDLSIYMLFLEENLSELKSYKCLQVCSVITQCKLLKKYFFIFLTRNQNVHFFKTLMTFSRIHCVSQIIGSLPVTSVFCAHMQVLELLTQGESENLDTMCLLRTLGQVKTDLVDRKLASVVDGNSQSAHTKEDVELSKLKGKC